MLKKKASTKFLTLVLCAEIAIILALPVKLMADGKPRQAKKVSMTVTAYCPCKKCCGPNACGITSTGKNARKTRGVAAAPKLLPYGTKLNIPGIGILEVDDTGGTMRKAAKKGIYWIDIRFPTHNEALDFGKKSLEVEIL